MSQQTVSYNVATEAHNATTVPASVTTEATVFSTKDGKYHQKAQLTAYYSVKLSSNTVKIRYYYSLDNGGTYYPVQTKNLATGVLGDIPTILDSTTYQDGSSNSIAVEDIPMSGCNAFKITMAASSGTVTINSVRVAVRDN